MANSLEQPQRTRDKRNEGCGQCAKPYGILNVALGRRGTLNLGAPPGQLPGEYPNTHHSGSGEFVTKYAPECS